MEKINALCTLKEEFYKYHQCCFPGQPEYRPTRYELNVSLNYPLIDRFRSCNLNWFDV